MEVINKRRSVRNYLDKPVEDEKVEKLLRAAMQAPSAANEQPWEFVVVKNKKRLAELSEMGSFSSMFRDTGLAIILFANTDYLKFPGCWQQDMGAATQNILLEAVSLGLGAVWIGIESFKNRVECLRKLFDFPENLKPYSMISIGYPAQGHENKFIDRYDASRIWFEEYGRKTGYKEEEI